MKISARSVAASALVMSFALGAAQAQVAKPTYGADGVVHVPAFDLPPSAFMSAQGVDGLKKRAAMGPINAFPAAKNIAEMRAGMEKLLEPQVKTTEAAYPVNVTEQKIAGVPTRIFTPKNGKVDPHRVLINLHGGGFIMCADGCSKTESIPIAALGGFKVISVNYRQAPEATFPAASEDVAAVYSELLKTYKPKQIGIYGCSAGGALSAEAAAWLPAHGLPQAGAIGVFGSGAARFAAGDSAYISAYVDGAFPPPPPSTSKPAAMTMPYFRGVDVSDPMVSPASDLKVLAKFPPTLVITGTRAPDLSPAVYTHSQLIKAGVPGDLIVGEGMGHCYIMDSTLPESQDAYRAIINFFRKNLG